MFQQPKTNHQIKQCHVCGCCSQGHTHKPNKTKHLRETEGFLSQFIYGPSSHVDAGHLAEQYVRLVAQIMTVTIPAPSRGFSGSAIE